MVGRFSLVMGDNLKLFAKKILPEENTTAAEAGLMWCRGPVSYVQGAFLTCENVLFARRPSDRKRRKKKCIKY